MRVFLTGGSGFLGQRIIKRLVGAQHQVFALVRSPASAEIVKSAGAFAVKGDINSSSVLPLDGVDVVVHAAAPLVFWGPWAMYEREIVKASQALYRRAAEQSVTRFIYISSESVLQSHASLLDIDESQPFADPPNSDYGRAKKAAEKALQGALRESPQCELLILRPTFIWAADAPALQLMGQKVKTGQFAWIDAGRAPFEAVHVENVAQAVEKALSGGRSGAAYLVTDNKPYTTYSLLAPLLAKATGVAVPTRSVPRWLAAPLAAAIEAVWRVLGVWGTPPPLSRFEVAFMSQPRRYRIGAATQELGYQPEHFVTG